MPSGGIELPSFSHMFSVQTNMVRTTLPWSTTAPYSVDASRLVRREGLNYHFNTARSIFTSRLQTLNKVRRYKNAIRVDLLSREF
jgi:hypothetical protein